MPGDNSAVSGGWQARESERKKRNLTITPFHWSGAGETIVRLPQKLVRLH
jgi:hypothetical protein